MSCAPLNEYRCLQQDDSQVVEFLLSTEIIPLSLRIMESGSDLSRTVRRCSIDATTFDLQRNRSQVATFIVQKILVDDNGLQYICATFDRFNAGECASFLSSQCPCATLHFRS